MNLFELFVKIGVDDQASDKISDLSSKLGSGLKTAAKIGTAAVGAAAAGIAALTTAAVNNYAEYEQLVGGAELLFGDAFDFVQEKASEAYKNVQMSQNEYLQQVNGFATGLKTALNGNEKAAAELSDRIITAEADIVAATGNSQEAVQNAFNGIMKSNYTMLDNLQLGITPTKEGFQEVIDVVNKWNTEQGRATEYQIDNLADAQSALLDYIEMQGLSGYASMEAASTISGSVASMKSAWENLLTGLSDGNADIEQLVGNLVTTIVGDGTESNLGVLGNIIPAVETALNGASTLVSEALPKIMEIIPEIINENLPVLAEAAVGIIQSLIDGVSQNQEMLFNTILDVVTYLAESFITMLPQIVDLGLDLIVSLANGIADNTGELLPTIVDTIMSIGEALIENAPELINAGIELASAIMDGVLQQFEGLEPIIMAVVAAFGAYKAITLASEVASKAMAAAQWLVNAAMNANPIVLVVTLIAGLVAAIITLWKTNDGFREAVIGIWESIKGAFVGAWEAIKAAWSVVKDFFADIWNGIKSTFSVVGNVLGSFFTEAWNKIKSAFSSWKNFFSNLWSQVKNVFSGAGSWFLSIGKDIVNGVWSGIQSMVSWFTSKVKSFFSGIVNSVKNVLGIHSPSKVFASIGKYMAEGLGEGWDDKFSDVRDEIDKSLDFDDHSMRINASVRKIGEEAAGISGAGYGGTSIGNVTINIDGAKYSNENSLAEAIAEALQNMTDRRAAVYA